MIDRNFVPSAAAASQPGGRGVWITPDPSIHNPAQKSTVKQCVGSRNNEEYVCYRRVLARHRPRELCRFF